jgi:release factor glutamine methyltransferase
MSNFAPLILKDINEVKIAAAILKINSGEVLSILSNQTNLTPKKIEKLNQKLELFRSGYPLDYIIGYVELSGMKFVVNKFTLIPRPETIDWIDDLTTPTNKVRSIKFQKPTNLLLDVGCGCGLIGLSLAPLFNKVILTDVSKSALKISKENAEFNNIKNVEFYCSNLLENQDLKKKIENLPYTLIANLPYVPTKDLKNVDANNVQFEPKKAIFSGKDGLYLFKKLIITIKNHPTIKPSEIILELDPRNIQEAEDILKKLYQNTFIWHDNYGKQRILQAW